MIIKAKVFRKVFNRVLKYVEISPQSGEIVELITQ